tara:strand:- start:2332 stop:2865 length:534 start_codon:yes stop_codon:yes gene_type:complete
MSEWRDFVKDVAQKQGIKYNEALKVASPLWKEHKSGKSGDTMTIQEDAPEPTPEPAPLSASGSARRVKKVKPEPTPKPAPLSASGSARRVKKVKPVTPSTEKSIYDSKEHPYYNDFLHIRKRTKQKGGGIWGDIWNGISSVLKPAMAIIGGPIGALASTLVPTITPTGGVNMLGTNL